MITSNKGMRKKGKWVYRKGNGNKGIENKGIENKGNKLMWVIKVWKNKRFNGWKKV